MDYELYHDETQEHGYWHGMLLVPVVFKHLICDHLEQVRSHTKYKEPISFKRIKEHGKISSSAEAWIDFAIGGLITKFNSKYPYPISTGERIQGKKTIRYL